MKFKLNKKIFILGSILVTTLAATSLVVVSCSNTSNPTIAASVTFKMTENTLPEPYTVVIANGVSSVNPAVEFDGEKFTSIPVVPADFTTLSHAAQKAVAYFTSLNNVVIWMQSLSFQVQNFLSASPLQMRDHTPKFSTDALDLGFGLAATINEGVDTARLGLREIQFNSNLWQNANKITKGDKEVKVDSDPENIKSNMLESINLKFNWWKTNSANNVLWQSDTWDVQNQVLNAWKYFIENGHSPKPVYNLKFSNLNFDAKELWSKNDVDGLITYSPTGKVEILNPSHAFKFTNITADLDGSLSQNVFNFLIQADKIRRGDLLNQEFWPYITDKAQEENMNNLRLILV